MINLIIRWLPVFIAVLICFATLPEEAFCDEAYYINDDKVVLYKIINWWYDNLAESYQLCGSRIRHTAGDAVQIDYNPSEKKLVIHIKEGFADLLSIFKDCNQCRGPSYFESTWLNKAYFGVGKFVAATEKERTRNTYLLSSIEPEKARRILNISEVIEIELEGVICGLMDGKIALHRSGNLLKTCQTGSGNKNNDLPITLNITNNQTNEVLARFSMVFDGTNPDRP